MKAQTAPYDYSIQAMDQASGNIAQHNVHPVNKYVGGSFARKSPLLMRIHADDQDTKTLCLFWIIFVVFVIVIAVIGNFALPSSYATISNQRGLQGTNLKCNNPSGISGNQITCASFSTNNLILGAVITEWSSANQFGVINLQIIPNNLNQDIQIHQNFTLQTYRITTKFNAGDRTNHLQVKDKDTLTSSLDFQSENAAKLSSSDGSKIIGYTVPLAIIYKMPQNFLLRVTFTKASDFNFLANFNLRIVTVNSQFTYYTIGLRFFFFGLSIIAMALYLIRFVKIPSAKKTMEQRMVAIGSILLIMFNDPFYPITVLKPNGGSAFFSILFMVNLVVFLILLWIMTADRIFYNENNVEFKQFFTLNKIIYVSVFWVQLIVCLMVYSMAQINDGPILSNDFLRKYISARVIIPVTFFLAVAYVGYRYIKIAMNDEGKLWRDYIFMIFSSIFIVVLLAIVASNSLVLFNYSGSQILVVYGFINTYIYYLQYMFTITKRQIEKIEKTGGIQEMDNYDIMTVSTIEVVDVNLQQTEKKTQKQEELSGIKMMKENQERTEQQSLRY